MPIINVAGLKVRAPKGQSRLNSNQEHALSALVSSGKAKKGAGCVVVLFKGKTKSPIAISRCEGSNKLTGPAAQARGKRLGKKFGKANIKKVCHKANGKFARKGTAGCKRK